MADSTTKRYLQNGANDYPHIGKMLDQQLMERKIPKAEIARKLVIASNNVLKYTRQQSLQVGILWNLSKAIGYNFFEDLAALLPPNPKPVTTKEVEEALLEKDRKIEALEVELKLYKQLIIEGMKGKD